MLLPLLIRMRFTKISEYFYKFYSALLIIVLPPILAFIVLYLQPSRMGVELQDEPEKFTGLTTSLVFIWLITFIFSNKKIKSARNGQGLRQKLERYFRLTIVRYTVLTLTGLLLAFAFHLMRNDIFSLLLVVQLVGMGASWPFPKKVCKDLKLRGDEFQMVFFRKDVL